ncbi:lipopolysaccharide biosynthesis protein [Undibacterium arcticum]|uniref:lipopolysaccharide biosynthesis protein n=1 Tax=Undibacterium arcticum TaxID=1762892 RepID=UPI0036156F7B
MKSSTTTFWSHVITVLTGSVAAQALPLLAAPLITRLCGPEDMGAFSVWLGVIQIAAVVATLRLETAMILDHDSNEQQTCFSVIAYSATILALTITLCAFGARALGFHEALKLPWLGLLTLGVGMWLTAYTQTIIAYATSYHAFGKAARAKVWAAGTIALTQVGLLYAGIGGIALMAGQIIGLAIGLVAAVLLMAPPGPTFSIKPTRPQRNYLKKHEAFWRYALPADLINVVAGKLPLFLIGIKHGLLAAGLFALTQRVLAAPASILAASVLEVFKRQAVEDFQTFGNCQGTYIHTFKTLFMLGVGPTLFIFIFSEDLFALVFGESWRPAGAYARIMAPLFLLVSSPVR